MRDGATGEGAGSCRWGRVGSSDRRSFFGPHPEAHVLPAEADVIHAASVLRATRAAARPAASKDAWRGRPDNFTTDTWSAQGLPREAGALRGKRDDVCRTCCFGRRQDQFIMAVDRPCRTQLRPGAADSGPQLGQTIQPAEQSIMSVTSRSEAARKRGAPSSAQSCRRSASSQEAPAMQGTRWWQSKTRRQTEGCNCRGAGCVAFLPD